MEGEGEGGIEAHFHLTERGWTCVVTGGPGTRSAYDSLIAHKDLHEMMK